jgi:hypothetical protein
LKKLGWVQLKYDKSFFCLPSGAAGGLPRAIMIITVDDIFGCGEPGMELSLKRLEKEFEFPITIKFLEESGMDDYIGQHVHRAPGRAWFEQFHYIDSIKPLLLSAFDKVTGELKPDQSDVKPLTGGRGKNANRKRTSLYDHFRSLLGKGSFCWSQPWHNFVFSSASGTTAEDGVKEISDTVKKLNKAVEEMQTMRGAPLFLPLDPRKPLVIYLCVVPRCSCRWTRVSRL